MNLLGDHKLGEGGADKLVDVFLKVRTLARSINRRHVYTPQLISLVNVVLKEAHLLTLLDLKDGMITIDASNKGESRTFTKTFPLERLSFLSEMTVLC